MTMSDEVFIPLFEADPYCDQCKCKLRPLGVSTIACNHTSLTVGIDRLDAHNYDRWMVVESDFPKLLQGRLA